MPTELSLAAHLEGLREALLALVRYADRAGLDAPVPTCPGWVVRDLVAHTGQAHRSTAAALRGEGPVEAGDVDGDPMEWLRDGAIELVEAITRAPQGFLARRACHLTTLRAVDALSAALGRRPEPGETWVGPDLAVDGIDEMLTGLATGPTSRLRTAEEAVLLVAADDVLDWWLVRVGPRPAVARRGSGPRPEVPVADWVLAGSAVWLYLALWDRAARPMSPDRWPGPPHAGWSSA
ncbi:maleylpyruvate isomerase family mycothiol-dependent enzyme [Nocardioides sp. MAH-18]|uniref:Maleylpyruvate isomerase family mycothiol-dependent enzyme n=1 Tax=Nocardioides agri TaxID=2682843 RepID=A0A6L6XS11_9ACTN|nr:MULTISPECIES: maleylpyruvate isomerase N-terminal domain-containing protein [unclassified Nocardioides]MBA2955127.1 maleylpyruvate isomerase N-terminal domain-containing protein [Nocardioides sp. CGMCC 1.13656]MVQ49980.1 maleylpyruvate isomerase family mycothiol-dependent enzyme [Nocardioides sp. MAH-18]